jgi:hypothetical protein
MSIGASIFQPLHHPRRQDKEGRFRHQNLNVGLIDKIPIHAIIVHMNAILLNDPDIFIQWMRTEAPGENPRWHSQCGYVEQISFGNYPMFQGFVGFDELNNQPGKSLEPMSSLNAAKREVERVFQKKNKLAWAY